MIALVDTMLDEVRAAVDAGLDRAATLERVRLLEPRARFTDGDPVLDYLFDEWFRKPAVVRAFDELEAETADSPEGP